MDSLPPEVFDIGLEHMTSLEDLGALWLMNRQAARQCANVRARTLWKITYRTFDGECERCDLPPPDRCNCNVVKPALEEPESVPFKVRAWLYRRASLRSFGTSQEALGRCVVSVADDMKNPYDVIRGGTLGVLSDTVEDYDAKVGEWRKTWTIFKRYLTMQRVQRVNRGDLTVRPEWRRSYELVKDEDSEEDAALVEALREANSLMGRERDKNVLSWR